MKSDILTTLLKREISIDGHDYYIYGDSEDHYFTTLPKTFSDHDSLYAILKRSKFNPQVIFDVGANLGLFSLGVNAAFPTAKIYCYEPHPKAYESLVVNNKLIGDRLIVNNCAISDTKKNMLFHPGGPINNSRSSGAHLMNDSHWRDENFGISVPVSTLDEQVEIHSMSRVDFIKIDVEGFELDVLKGAVEMIKQFSPLIFLEFNSWALMALKNINPRNAIDYLGRNFTYVYRCNKDMTLTKLETSEDRIRFLHDNLILHGCVDDLFISNKDFLESFVN